MGVRAAPAFPALTPSIVACSVPRRGFSMMRGLFALAFYIAVPAPSCLQGEFSFQRLPGSITSPPPQHSAAPFSNSS